MAYWLLFVLFSAITEAHIFHHYREPPKGTNHIKMRNPGVIVQLQDGRKGRTYNSKELVNGKVPVYVEGQAFVYSEQAILVSPERLRAIGFID
jgi:hypothetical protein